MSPSVRGSTPAEAASQTRVASGGIDQARTRVGNRRARARPRPVAFRGVGPAGASRSRRGAAARGAPVVVWIGGVVASAAWRSAEAATVIGSAGICEAMASESATVRTLRSTHTRLAGYASDFATLVATWCNHASRTSAWRGRCGLGPAARAATSSSVHGRSSRARATAPNSSVWDWHRSAATRPSRSSSGNRSGPAASQSTSPATRPSRTTRLAGDTSPCTHDTVTHRPMSTRRRVTTRSSSPAAASGLHAATAAAGSSTHEHSRASSTRRSWAVARWRGEIRLTAPASTRSGAAPEESAAAAVPPSIRLSSDHACSPNVPWSRTSGAAAAHACVAGWRRSAARLAISRRRLSSAGWVCGSLRIASGPSAHDTRATTTSFVACSTDHEVAPGRTCGATRATSAVADRQWRRRSRQVVGAPSERSTRVGSTRSQSSRRGTSRTQAARTDWTTSQATPVAVTPSHGTIAALSAMRAAQDTAYSRTTTAIRRRARSRFT